MGLNQIEQRVCDWLAEQGQSLQRELAAHVAMPTGQGHTPGLDRYRSNVADRLRALGAAVREISGGEKPQWLALPGSQANAPSVNPPVIQARKINHSKNRRILIVGHLDTVHDPHGTFQSLQVQSDTRIATGPGAADMKGGIVIALHALEALREASVDANWTFLLNSDEETGSFHSIDALQRAAREHDVGLVLEPALPDGSLVVERMGSGQFKIEVFGRSAHVGRDFARGISAVNRLAQIILQLNELSDEKSGVIVNIGPLQGGNVTNAVADYAACWGNVRFADAATARKLESQFDALATPVDSQSLPRVVVHHLFNRPAKPLTPQTRQLADLARAVAADVGQQLPFASTGGVCDGNILQDAGLPTIDTLGVRGGNLHRTDEFIELPSLVERAQLLAVLLARLSASPGDVPKDREIASK